MTWGHPAATAAAVAETSEAAAPAAAAVAAHQGWDDMRLLLPPNLSSKPSAQLARVYQASISVVGVSLSCRECCILQAHILEQLKDCIPIYMSCAFFFSGVYMAHPLCKVQTVLAHARMLQHVKRPTCCVSNNKNTNKNHHLNPTPPTTTPTGSAGGECRLVGC